MSPTEHVRFTVGVVAAVAVLAVVGITLATRQTPATRHPHAGKPPIASKLATPLAPQIRQAYRSWPKGSLDTMLRLGQLHPRDPVVQLYLGIALVWGGYGSDAVAPLQAAKQFGRDTSIEVQADSLLHPQYFPDAPIFTPMSDNPLLLRGSKLQLAGHQHSAERLYALAAKRKPTNVEAQVAAAVGRFDKDNLSASFSRLGPLTKRFPKSQLVRYYLGYMLAVTGQGTQAVAQFKKTVALGPSTVLGRSAAAFLAKIREAALAAKAK